MAADFWIVMQWWGILFFTGLAAYPLSARLFSSWHDRGYFFAKAVGLAAITWIVYVLGTLRVMPFSVASVAVAMCVVFLLGLWGNRGNKGNKGNWGRMALEELFFLAALLFWSWIKGHEPSIRGLEKFMDYGFIKSILNARYFPPQDMWYAGHPVNYYYFGHLVTAVLTKISGIDLAYTFNLMLATIFALTLTMSLSIGLQIGGKWGGVLTAFLVTLAGNLQTIYAFTRGYTGDNVQPFWELFWPLAEFWKRLPEGLNTYWYANATRFIPFTIHEFPGYSFVVSDVHGHVLSLPFTLLAIAMLIQLSVVSHQTSDSLKADSWRLKTVFYGFLVGVLLMTNALDGPIYFALLAFLVVVNSGNGRWSKVLQLTFVGGVAVVTSLPFLIHFKSFVNGLAVNCPPGFLANTKIGLLIFEEAEKCQRSPLWMLAILWGFFIYCGGWLLLRKKYTHIEKLLLIFFGFSLLLILFPEFFYFKDIYPMHFRSNTMFKLGYQAFILFSLVAGYVISHARKKIFFLLLIPLLFLVSIFPVFAVRSYFGGLKHYDGIDGFGWMRREYPDDWAGIEWLNKKSCQLSAVSCQPDRFAIVEADGDSYTDYGRFSAFTGFPTIIGWPVHEWLWRGSYDVVAPRREEVREVYESEDPDRTRSILSKYGTRFITVGTLEREKYKNLQEWKFGVLGKEAFRSGTTVLYEMIY